jgi:exosortase
MSRSKLAAISQAANPSNVAIAVKAIALTAVIVALFYQDLSIIFRDALQNEATSYVLAIPFILAYLLYRKRKMLRAVVPYEATSQPRQTRYLATISGILVSAIAVTLYWYGSYTFTPLEYHILSLPILAVGLTLTLFNPQTLRQLAFPIVFLIFLTPPPSEILYGLGSTLSVISSEASSAIVSALGIPSTISGESGNPTIVITRPDQTTMGFTVDIACSGIYSLLGFLLFAAFIAYVIRDKAWKKATIFVLGLPLIYLFNIARITTILLIGYQFGQALALQIFHLIGGWVLIFLGTLILLTVSDKVLRTQIFSKPQLPTKCFRCNPGATAPNESFCSNCGRLLKYPNVSLRKKDVAKIAAITIVIFLLLWIQAPVFALTKVLAQIIIQTPDGEQGNTQLLPQIPGYTLQFYYRDTNFEQLSGQDYSLIFLYNNTDGQSVWVGLEVASTMSRLHRWETCLVTWPVTRGYQPKVVQLDLRDVQIVQNPPEIARYFAFQYKNSNYTQVVVYWYDTSTFTIDNASQQKHVEISVVAYSDTVQKVSALEEELLPFATTIADYWQPMKWVSVALALSQNGFTLITTVTALLAFVITYGIYEDWRERGRSIMIYQKIAREDQRIIDAVYQTQKNAASTSQNITTTIEGTTPTAKKWEELHEKLIQAEKVGLIKSQTTNRNDDPVLTWRTNFHKPTYTKEKLRTFTSFLRPSKHGTQD